MRRIATAGDHAPRLGDGVAAAFVAFVRTQRRAVVVVAAAVPLAVPAAVVPALAHGGRGLLPARRAVLLAASLRIWRERVDGGAQEPAQPRTLAPALFADAVHAVVPVAGTEQRQVVRTQRQAGVDGARAVFVQAGVGVGGGRPVVGFVHAWFEFGSFDEGLARVEHRGVAGRVHVVAGNERQPQAVVGHARADALAARRQPPVLHIAFLELAPGRAQQLRAGFIGFGDAGRHHVLQLVAETVGTAGLVVGGARPHPAAQRPVQQPAVEQAVHAAIGRAPLPGAEDRSEEHTSELQSLM